MTILGDIAQSSGVGHIEPAGVAPVVTAASSQYFERTYNRLVAASPPVLEPIAPVVPILPVAPSPPVFVPRVPNNVPVPVNPSNPSESSPPNVAIAVATANAAAPVATILLPPYPFGLPPGYGFISPGQQTTPFEENTKEITTQKPTTKQTEPTTTEQIQETTPKPSNSDDSFVQALPSNDNINFKQYGLPLPPHSSQLPQQQPQPLPKQPWPQTQPRPQQQWVQQQQPKPQFWSQNQSKQPQRPQQHPHFHVHTHEKPQKLKTSVEIVPVPLAYITPPPINSHVPHHHIKVVKHIYGFVPEHSAKIIIRPLKSSHRIRSVSGTTRLVAYKAPSSAKNIRLQTIQPINRNAEPTTFNPFPRPNTKPPRV